MFWTQASCLNYIRVYRDLGIFFHNNSKRFVMAGDMSFVFRTPLWHPVFISMISNLYGFEFMQIQVLSTKSSRNDKHFISWLLHMSDLTWHMTRDHADLALGHQLSMSNAPKFISWYTYIVTNILINSRGSLYQGDWRFWNLCF